MFSCPLSFFSVRASHLFCFLFFRYMSIGSAAGVAAAQLVSGDVAMVQDVNVTIVQGILTSKFSQRIHGPPFAPPPGPQPKYFNVSGAGSTAFNGQFRDTGNIFDGQSVFCGVSPACLYSEEGVWRLAVMGKELFYVANNPSAEPPLSPGDWHCANGTAPLPLLIPGPL